MLFSFTTIMTALFFIPTYIEKNPLRTYLKLLKAQRDPKDLIAAGCTFNPQREAAGCICFSTRSSPSINWFIGFVVARRRRRRGPNVRLHAIFSLLVSLFRFEPWTGGSQRHVHVSLRDQERTSLKGDLQHPPRTLF